MAAHDFIYYHDDEDPASGYRRRVVIIPVGNADLFPEGPDPGWMEDPEEGAGWIRCPQGSFTFGEPEECGYDAEGVPVSFPDTSVMKVTIHKHIAGAVPDLVEVLDNYTAAITIPSSELPLYDVTGKNLWYIVHDNGDGSITDWDLFETVFAGCQRVIPQKEGAITIGGGYSVSIELYDLTRVLMEDITMRMACAETMKQSTPSAPQSILYDLVYEDAAGAWVAVTNQPNLGTAYMYQLCDLFAAMAYLCQQYYRKLRRGQFAPGTGNTVNFVPGLGDQNIDVGSPELLGSPYTHITFYPQNYANDMERGDVALAYDELYFIGEIRNGDGIAIAGLLVEQKGDAETWATDRTMWEFLKAMCEGAFCQATIRQRNKTQIGVNFHGVKESTVIISEPGTPRSLTLADFDVPDYDEGGVVPAKEAAGLIANASVTIESTGSADLTEYTQRSLGTAVDKGYTAELALHNLPTQGEGRTDGAYGSAPITPDGRGVRRKRFAVYNLYYLDDPAGEGAGFIRVHHDCDIRLSGTESHSTAHSTAIVLPDRTVIESTLFDLYGVERNIDKIIGPYIVVQQEGGLMRHVALLYTQVFGNKQQTLYQIRLPAAMASYGDIGSHYLLSPVDSNGNYSAQMMTDPEITDLRNMYGRCVLLRVKPFVAFGDEENGTPYPVSECTFLGIAFS